ncbi:hypothetical protein K501DRAFT_32952 [Backusella circina FSU 941]|nr:hypothetical protein K501DRAFT_32952 [Backusella circina FSU 941]
MSEFQSYHHQHYEDDEENHYLIQDVEIENPKRTSWCIESDEQQLREDLIQRATHRLKRRMLEEDLSKIMQQITVRQAHLEALEMDTTTTIDIVTDISGNSNVEEINQLRYELQLLKIRLDAHRADLQELEPTASGHSFPVSSQEMAKSTSKVSHQSSAMSRLSSDSIFGRALSTSSRATSISDQSDSRSSLDFTSEQKRERRRRRIQYQRQKYQASLARASAMDDDDDYLSLLDDSENASQHIWVSKSCMDDDAPFYDLAGKKSFKQGSFCGSVYCDTDQQFAPIPVPEQGHSIDTRSRRRQKKRLEQLRQKEQEEEEQHQYHHHHHQQEYQHQHYYQHSLEQDFLSDNEGSVASNMTFSSISTLSNLLPEIRHPLSLNTPVPQCTTNDSYFGPKGNSSNNDDMQYYKNAMHAWLSDSDSVFEETQSIARIRKSIESYTYPDRNVLDEAMSFLDGLGEDGDDGGFGEDMYLLLHNPDLCCRPLSEIQTTMHQLKQGQSLMSLLFTMLWPGTYIQFFISMAYSTACTSLEWCRFLSILGAAVVISLLHGPKDLKSSAR